MTRRLPYQTLKAKMAMRMPPLPTARPLASPCLSPSRTDSSSAAENRAAVVLSATNEYTVRTDDKACSAMAPGRAYWPRIRRARPTRTRPYMMPGTTSSSTDGSAASVSRPSTANPTA